MMNDSTLRDRRTCRFTLPALLFSLVTVNASHAAIAPGELTITEVMANPASVSDTQGEWFEVYNSSGAILDLTGLVIRDTGSNQHTVTTTISLAVDSYFVLGRNDDSSLNGGYNANYQYSNFSLGNSSDEIILEFDGLEIDSVGWNGDSNFGIAGVSAELTSAGFIATPSGLIYGDGDSGTPGSVGSDPGLELAPPPEVPVPAAGWLLASALGGLIASRRRS